MDVVIEQAAQSVPIEIRGEVMLWRAVLQIGIRDAQNGKGQSWIGTADFREVCENAFVEPDYLIRLIK